MSQDHALSAAAWYDADMSKPKLPAKEQALLDSVESGNYESTLTESRRRELEAMASNTLKGAKRIAPNRD